MNIVQGNAKTRIITATLLLSFFAGTAVAGGAQPAEDKSLTDQASEYIRDYLSDHRRAGSLAGSILGGALFAHPAGPILGSLVGFFVGKQTMFNEDKARSLQAQSLLARRDIVPKDGKGQGIPTLSFANAQGIKFDTPPAANPAATNTVVAARSAPEATSEIAPQAPQVPIPMAAPTSFSREKIATMCGGGRALIDPRLQSLCFYFQGSWQDERGPATGPTLAQANP